MAFGTLKTSGPTPPRGDPAARLDPDLAAQRRRWEGRSQSFGDGRKWLPFQMLDPLLRLVRAVLGFLGLYRPLARRAGRWCIVENDVYLRHIGPSLKGLRILHLSDLHIDGSPGAGDRLARQLAEVDYDLAVITGDFRLEIRGGFHGVLEEMKPLMAELNRCPLGAYAVLGNHDELAMVQPLEEMGLRFLLNESVRLKVGFSELFLAGVDDAHFYGTDDIDRALADVPVADPCVFLCHSPDLIDEAAERYCDLYLCGHTHGGQICLRNGRPILSNASVSRRFCTGAWIHGGMRGFTSRGIGFSGIPWRSHCPAEIVIHTLMPERRGQGRIRAEEEAEAARYADDESGARSLRKSLNGRGVDSAAPSDS